MRWIFALLWLLAGSAWATAYSLPAATFAACSGTWNPSTYTCQNGKVTLQAGDTLTATQALTIYADKGFELQGNNTVGSNSASVSLRTDYATIVTAAGTSVYGSLTTGSGGQTLSGTRVNGSVSGNGDLKLTGVTVTGTLSGSGNAILADSEVVGGVQVLNSFTATNSRFGANVSSNGTVSLTSGQSVAGNISGRNIILSGITVGGSVSGTGSGTFTNSSIAGTVTMSNGLTATNTTFSSTLTSTNGAVSLTGGSVAGLVNVGCCQVTVSGGATISNGIIAGNNGITISDSTVSGALTAGNNPIKLTNVTMTSGSINPGSNNVTITGGSITADITDANNVYIQQGAQVTGDVQARYTVTLTASTLTGDISGSSGYELQHVYLEQSSTVYGNVTVGTSWQTIEGDKSDNHIYGVCTYAKVNPASLCTSASSPVHHYQLAYASQALTCQAQTVTVTACTDAACSSSYTAGSSSLTVTPGGAAISFTGSTTTSIAVRSAGTVTLAVSNATPSVTDATLCRIDGAAASTNCNLTFADSGLLVQAPDLLAGQGDTLSVTAVRKSDNGAACVPAFANVTRPVAFWSIYVDPDAATQVGNRAVSVAATSVANSSAGSTSVDLAFDAQGTARVALNYFDAGQVQLNALYQGNATRGDAGLTMSGSDSFVSRPATLGIVASRPDGSLLDGSACLTDVAASGCATWKAGDDFTLTITPLAADGSTVTLNFRLSGIALGSTLLAPSGGVDGSLAPSSYDHPLGGAYGLNVRHSEVGVFRLGAAAQGSYFGYDVSGQSGAVGRFTPAYLGAIASAQLTPACGTFSYQQQPIGFATGQTPLLTVTGYNRQGGVTRNYDRGDFWRLSAPQREAYQSITGRSSLDASGRLQSLGSAQSAAVGDTPGDGARQFGWSDDHLLWAAALVPLDDDLPFPSVAGTAIARLTLPAAQLSDADGICYASGGCTDFSYDFGGSEVRLGRLDFGNAFGSELQALDVPFWLESWQRVATSSPQGAFRTESADSCSAPSLGNPALVKVAGALQTADLAGAAVSAPSLGVGAVHLPAPGAEGSVSVGLSGLEGSPPLLPWLLYDWSGSATRQAGRGLATFGVYKGSDALIFRRETYR